MTGSSLQSTTGREAAPPPSTDLEAALRALGRPVHGVIHDLRGILNSMNMSLAVLALRAESSASGPDERLASFQQDLARLVRLVEAVAGHVPPAEPRPQLLDLRTLVEDLRLVLQQAAREGGVALSVHLPDPAVPLQAEGHRLRLALLDVACRGLAAGRGGALEMVLERRDPSALLRFEVTSGPGAGPVTSDSDDETLRRRITGLDGRFRVERAADRTRYEIELPLDTSHP